MQLESALRRQLKRAGISSLDEAPSPQNWATFVKQVNSHYQHMQDDRDMLTRSLDLSTAEMERLQEQISGEREQLRNVIASVADAIIEFNSATQHTLVSGSNWSEGTSMMTAARRRFNLALIEAIGSIENGEAKSKEVLESVRRNFFLFSEQITRLITKMSSHLSLQSELETAGEMQQRAVPAREIIATSGMEVAAYFKPASECGGDWWGHYNLTESKTLVLVADATGHGIPSAMLTMAAKATCDVAVLTYGASLTLHHLVGMLNAVIHSIAERTFMMSSCALIIDRRERKIQFVNAGHPFPYILRNGQVLAMSGNGTPIGAVSHLQLQPKSVAYMPGDILLMYTDGITESEDSLGNEFTEKGLRRALRECSGKSAADARDAIIDSVKSFATGPQSDDRTLVVLKLD